MVCSAIPTLISRSGKRLPKLLILLEPTESLTTAQIRESWTAISSSVAAKVSRQSYSWLIPVPSLVKFLHGAGIFLGVGHPMMPGRAIAHERYALPFVGMGDDAVGLAPLEGQLLEHIQQLGEIVTVDLAHREAKRRPLVGQRVEVHRALGEIALLQAVAVDDNGQIIELVMRGG